MPAMLYTQRKQDFSEAFIAYFCCMWAILLVSGLYIVRKRRNKPVMKAGRYAVLIAVVGIFVFFATWSVFIILPGL